MTKPAHGLPIPVDVKFRKHGQSIDRIVWLIAVAGMVEASLQAVDARLDGSETRFMLWLAGSGLIGALAMWVETVKRRSEG